MSITQAELKNVAEIIKSGGVIAYPTESVYGLGCDPDNLDSLKKILEIKNRPNDKGFIILVSDIEQISPYVQSLSQAELKQLTKPRDRATTFLIPKRARVPELLSGQFETIAVRITRHPIARAICDSIGGALVSTSCNLSGQPELVSAEQVKAEMPNTIDLIVEAECGGERPSQIIDLASGRVLRD